MKLQLSLLVMSLQSIAPVPDMLDFPVRDKLHRPVDYRGRGQSDHHSLHPQPRSGRFTGT